MLCSLRKHYSLCQVLSLSFVPGKMRIVLLLYVGPFFFFSVNTSFYFWRSDIGGCATVSEKSVDILQLFQSKPDLFLDLIQRKMVIIE